jgi:hypothetical protein
MSMFGKVSHVKKRLMVVYTRFRYISMDKEDR